MSITTNDIEQYNRDKNLLSQGKQIEVEKNLNTTNNIERDKEGVFVGGTVIDSKTNLPISNAKVTYRDQTVYTDKNGQYKIKVIYDPNLQYSTNGPFKNYPNGITWKHSIAEIISKFQSNGGIVQQPEYLRILLGFIGGDTEVLSKYESPGARSNPSTGFGIFGQNINYDTLPEIEINATGNNRILKVPVKIRKKNFKGAFETALPEDASVEEVLIARVEDSNLGPLKKRRAIRNIQNGVYVDIERFEVEDSEGEVSGYFEDIGTYSGASTSILQYIRPQRELVKNINILSYILGTAGIESQYFYGRWEADYLCGPSFSPLPPSGPCRKATRYYRSSKGKKINYYNLGVDKNGLPYFGRGYVQLTGKDNYRTFGNLLDIPLLENSLLAIDPVESFRIFMTFMDRGSNKILMTTGDPLRARAGVNGDSGAPVAAVYRKWLRTFQQLGYE